MNPSRIFVSDKVINTAASLLTRPFFRKRGIKLVDKKIEEKMAAEGANGAPTQMLEDMGLMIHNLLLAVDRWVSSENTDKEAAKRLIKSFGGMASKKNIPIVEAFQKRHGYDPPRFITLSPTKKCNLKCIGCYAESSAETDVSLDWDTVDRIITQQKELWGSHFTVISGGEPLMWRSEGKNILDMVEKHHDTFFLMYTNGTLITEEVAERMGRLGNITPSISVEGFEEETDWRRGKGVHKKVLRAYERLHNAGVMCGMSITATKNNAELVFSKEFIDFYFKKQGIYYAWIFQYMPVGRAFSLELMPTPEQRVDMMEKMNRYIKEDNLFIADFWNSGTLCNGCVSAGRKGGYIYITWDGTVTPCVFNPYSTDNIVDIFKAGGTIDDAIDSPFMKKIRKWQDEYYDHGGTDGDNGNMLTPCPMRDHHAEMRGIIEEVGAEPIDDPAEEALTDKGYYDGIVQYGKDIDNLTRKKWDEHYLKKNGTSEEVKDKEGINA